MSRILKKCLHCNREFLFCPSQNRQFCCRKCADLFKTGKPSWNKGLTSVSDERIRKLHEKQKGQKRPEISKMLKEKWQENKGKTYEEIYGEEKSKQIKKQQSEKRKGKASKLKGKTYEEIYGIEKAKKRKEKISNSLKIILNKPKVKRKQQIARFNQIKKNNGIAHPNYNLKSCEIFKKFDELNNTSGRYAVYGDGEYLIKEILRYPDYINFDLKLIIEIDEPYHFEKSTGELREIDKIRQEEIMKIYPDFRFLRFKEEEMNKILELNLKELLK